MGFKIAAVQATYVLMNRDDTIDRVEERTAEAAHCRARQFVAGGRSW